MVKIALKATSYLYICRKPYFMKKILSLFVFVFIAQFSLAQVVINELDSDSEGIDNKEFIELKTDAAYTSLDGYVVVFFNGSSAGNNTSYYAIDLDGYTTDINGILLIGSSDVSPIPQLLIPPNTIQNGADAVGIYLGSYYDFPDYTLATTDNLIDALVYGTSDPTDTELLNLLGLSEQIDEDENNNKDFESIQRNADGTYFVGTPTPRQTNDGSGVILNGVAVSFDQDQYDEGDQMIIDFTTDSPVEEDLNLNFSLSNGTFDEDDYTGNTSVIIPQGQSSVSTTITLVDDNADEGDEVLLFDLADLPPTYVPLNDLISIRVVDNDYTTADFGTPVNPTYGIVESTQPVGYYDSLDGKSGDALRQAIQDIIADPDVVRVQTYTDVIDILKEADQNPENSNQVWLVYTAQGRAKLDFQTTSNNTGTWNREHTFPRSRGGFHNREGDDIADGKDIYWTTSPDSTRQGNSDAHALRAVDGPENSARNNKNYGPMGYNGPDGTSGSFKGDVARSTLYMTIRYNGLAVVDGYPTTDPIGQLGDLQTLLEWNEMDPADDYEMNRNNVVYTWQYNRNPFIDQPELIEYLWGDHVGEVWHQEMSVEKREKLAIKIYPNPAQNQINISGIKGKSTVQLFSLDGRKLATKKINGNSYLNLNLSAGMYIVRITNQHQSFTKKLIVR